MSTLKDITINLNKNNKNNFQIIKRLGINPKYKLTVKIGAEASNNYIQIKCCSFKLYEGIFTLEHVFGGITTCNIVDHKKDMYDLSIPLLSNTMGKISINRLHANLRTNSRRKVELTLQNSNEIKIWGILGGGI